MTCTILKTLDFILRFDFVFFLLAWQSIRMNSMLCSCFVRQFSPWHNPNSWLCLPPWLRLSLSRLGNIQTSLILLSAWRRLASALAAPEFDIALGLSSVWLLPIWLYRKRRVASTRNVGKKQRFCPSVRHKPCEVGARTGRNVVRRGRGRRRCQSSLATWRMMPWRVVEMKSVISSISGSGAICS